MDNFSIQSDKRRSLELISKALGVSPGNFHDYVNKDLGYYSDISEETELIDLFSMIKCPKLRKDIIGLARTIVFENL